MALRAIDDAHAVFHGHELRTARLDIDLGSAKAGEDESDAAGDQVRAIELCGNVRREFACLESGSRKFRIGRRGEKIASETKEYPDPALVHRLYRIDGIKAALARRSEAKLATEIVQESLPHVVADTHCAVSLNVAMSAHRARSGAGTPDIALQKEKVHDLLDRRNRIAMLGESHGPATNGAITSHGDVCRFPDLFTSQPAGFLNLLPLGSAQFLQERLVAHAVLFDERTVEDSSRIPLFGSKHFQHDALDRCDITVYTNGQPKIGDSCRFSHKGWQRFERIREVLRIGEPTQADFRQHVDADNLAASLLGSLEAAQHSGVICAGILANHKDGVRLLEVFEDDGSLADADNVAERATARFVAHVRTVRQVVRPKLPDEELVKERCFVARLARRVKSGFVGRGQSVEDPPEEVERRFPFDRLVVRRSLAEDHRTGQSALLAEPIVGFSLEFRDGIQGKELLCNTLFCPFMSDSLGSIFTEFREASVVVGIRPRAALANKAVLLIDLPQRLRRIRRAHFSERMLYSFENTHHAARLPAGWADLRRIAFDWRLGTAVCRRWAWSFRAHATFAASGLWCIVSSLWLAE